MEGLFIPALFIVPESPWHWAKKGNDVKGKKSLNRIYGYISDFDVEHECEL